MFYINCESWYGNTYTPKTDFTKLEDAIQYGENLLGENGYKSYAVYSYDSHKCHHKSVYTRKD
jgi:hypothetical protein